MCGMKQARGELAERRTRPKNSHAAALRHFFQRRVVLRFCSQAGRYASDPITPRGKAAGFGQRGRGGGGSMEVVSIPKPSLEKKVGVRWRFQERRESQTNSRQRCPGNGDITFWGFFWGGFVCFLISASHHISSRCLSLQVRRPAAHSATGNRGRHLCRGVKECFK